MASSPGFFSETNELILKFTWKFKGPKRANTTPKRTKWAESHFLMSELTAELQEVGRGGCSSGAGHVLSVHELLGSIPSPSMNK